MNQVINRISAQLSLKVGQVEEVLKLFADGATVAFISRYRKERTGNLDDVAVKEIEILNKKYDELLKRRKTIIDTIHEQKKLSPELKNKIESVWDLNELEDIYLPYKPKRRTKATVAKELGLEPLAKKLWQQNAGDIEDFVYDFVNDKVESVEEALQGARDIIAEWISEDQQIRQRVRNLFNREAVIYSKVVKGKEIAGVKFSDYFDFNESLKKCPSHRILAMRRGEDEGFLRLSVYPPADDVLDVIRRHFVKGYGAAARQVEIAATDSYKRLIQPSLENEFKKLSKEKADDESIDVFSKNLRQLLLSPPLGEKKILAIDPGFRTGCKVVCIDESGNLVHNATIYPHPPQNDYATAMDTILSLVKKYKSEAIAIGNGTASRETETFVRSIQFDTEMQVFVVSENGASVYSASEVAREEFPKHDVTVRGSVSIGRRLMDPLAELVKIDPKSIGVGQYQHDVDQNKLKERLDFVVESCVNSVGVNINTASKHLLNYVSGLGPKLAQNIVDYRKELGAFKSRSEIKKVPRMGDKAFEQCAGFLRIPGAKNPLDNSAVHPESYSVVKKMAADLNCSVADLISSPEMREQINLNAYTTGKIGLLTLQDIKKELEKPGRDPRTKIKAFKFADGINSMSDLYEGMVLPGIVTNITNFGAFVDIGVHQDGLVHISQIADRFVSNPSDIVSLHEHVKVKVVSVDVDRKRIQLSMKGL